MKKVVNMLSAFALMCALFVATPVFAKENVEIKNETKNTTHETLHDAVANADAGDVITLGEGVIDLTDSEEITVKIDKSLTIKGAGSDKTKIVRKGEKSISKGLIECTYRDGVHINISDLTMDGYSVSGILKWIADKNYVDVEPTDLPTFHVNNCIFTNTYNGVKDTPESYSNGFGVGTWGSAGVKVAPSKVIIENNVFTHLRGGIYFEEEVPVTNQETVVSQNTFENLGWIGLAGIPANAQIMNNHFKSTATAAIQYILNGQQTKTNTTIINNVIDSVTAIELAPYHWNDHNVNEDGTTNDDTKLITNDVLPTIKENIRHVDEILVGFLAYRKGSNELTVFDQGVCLDLNNNYTVGKKPMVKVTAQEGAPETLDLDKVIPEIKNDDYYVTENKDIKNTDTKEIVLEQTAISLLVGENAELKATAIDYDGNPVVVEWKTSDDKIVIVENGNVKAVAKGKATITVSTADGKSATCNVTVSEPVKPVDPSKPGNDANVNTGDTTHSTAYMALLVLSAGLLGVVTLKKKLEAK